MFFLLFRLLLLDRLWLSLGLSRLWLFFLIAWLITKVKRIMDSIKMEFFSLEFLGFKTTFDSFHVTKTTSEMFFRIEGFDFRLLFLFFIVIIILSLGLFSFCGLWFRFLLIRLLFLRLRILLIRWNISPKSLYLINKEILLTYCSVWFLAYYVDMIYDRVDLVNLKLWYKYK